MAPHDVNTRRQLRGNLLIRRLGETRGGGGVFYCCGRQQYGRTGEV